MIDFPYLHILRDADKGGGGGGGKEDPKPGEGDPTPGDQQPTGQVPQSWDEVFQHPRFKALNERAQKAEGELKTLKDAQTKAETERLESEKEFEKLYQGEKARNEQLQLDILKRDVAAEQGLPAEVVSRLRGTTREELEADAKSLLEIIKPADDDPSSKSRGIKPGSSRRSDAKPLDYRGMSPEEVRKNRQALLDQAKKQREREQE